MIKKARSLEEAKKNLRDDHYTVIDVDKHGYVALKGLYGHDGTPAEVARLTSSSEDKEIENLTRYLLRERHTTPFEFIDMDFEIACPIFVERQWIRHRTANTNEMSARYSELPCEIWEIPEDRIVGIPKGPGANRQGSGDLLPEENRIAIRKIFEESQQRSVEEYKKLIELGLTLELARVVLPFGVYTRKEWKMDMHNLLHFIQLRTDSHAQKEIQNYANAVAFLVKENFPIIYKAFENYRLNAISFSEYEIELLGKLVAGFDFETLDMSKLSKTEQRRFKEKYERIRSK